MPLKSLSISFFFHSSQQNPTIGARGIPISLLDSTGFLCQVVVAVVVVFVLLSPTKQLHVGCKV